MSNYMAYLPYPVRHARKVSAAAKLLFAELTSYADKDARTRVKNDVLCELFEVDVRTINRWLSELKKAQFIDIFLNGPERIITISCGRKSTPTKLSSYPDKNVGVTPTKMSTNTLYSFSTKVEEELKEVVSTELQHPRPEIQQPVPPSEIDVINYAEMHGIARDTAVNFWNYYEACAWELRPGVYMKKWQNMLVNWKLKDAAKADKDQQRRATGSFGPVAQPAHHESRVQQVDETKRNKIKGLYERLQD